MRTLVAKDLRAALVPVSIVAFIGAVQVIVHAADLALSLDGAVNGAWARAFETSQQAVRAASYVGCAVLPAWAAVELAFLEARPGGRSMLPALPPTPAQVVASKLLVLLACVVVLATSVSCAFWNGRWTDIERLAASNMVLTAPSVFSARVLWSWPVCSAFALAGLGASALARSRATGFAIAIGGPVAVFGAGSAAGLAPAWSAAIACASCAALAWLARGALAGGPVGGFGRRLRRHGVGSADAPRRAPVDGVAPVMRTIFAKDARAAAPVVAAALVFVLGFAAVAMALPVFGDRVMQELGIRSSDSVLRRLQVALPVALLAQLLVPGIVAVVLAYCDGRAAGRPMAALPVGRRAVIASKVTVCLAVLALFSALSLSIHGLSSANGDSFAERLLSVRPESGQLWALLVLCASGIPWGLALPAFAGDRRTGFVVALIGLPALFVAFGVAMQWAVSGWYDLIAFRALGVREWPRWVVHDQTSFGQFPPVLAAWAVVGAVAALRAVPAVTCSASTARLRPRTVRAVAIASTVTVVGGALAYVSTGLPIEAYRRNVAWDRSFEQAMNEESLEQLARSVVVGMGAVPRDPAGGFGPDARFDGLDAQHVMDAIWSRAPRVAAMYWNVERARPNRAGMALPPIVDDRWDVGFGPRSGALAVRAVNDPAAAVRELRRVADDPRIDGGIRIAAASWLGPVPAAMMAARVLADSPVVTERTFAIAVLANLRRSLSERPMPGDWQVALKEYEAGYEWCWLRCEARNALLHLERLAGAGVEAVADGGIARLGLAPGCVIDESIVARARGRIERGEADLCMVARALAKEPGVAWPQFDFGTRGVGAEVVAESACDCMLRLGQ